MNRLKSTYSIYTIYIAIPSKAQAVLATIEARLILYIFFSSARSLEKAPSETSYYRMEDHNRHVSAIEHIAYTRDIENYRLHE